MTILAYTILVLGIALSVPTVLFLTMLAASVWRDRRRVRDAKRIAGGK